MLLITEETRPDGARRLTAQGRLVGPWVDELRRVAGSVAGSGNGHGGAPSVAGADGTDALVLDLSAVTYVDREGVRLLRELAGRGVGLEGMSPYVAELLEPERGSA